MSGAEPSALYLHVPLCEKKCAYCDFFSLPVSAYDESFLRSMIEATLGRARILAERFNAARFDTLYIGGGTPTVLPIRLLELLLRGAGELLGRGGAPGIEWSVEANPESLGREALEIMRDCGVTRISLGVQSLDDRSLSLLGRVHNAERAVKAVEEALASGMAVSVDLMAALPPTREGLRRLDSEVRSLLDMGLSHLSIYDLVLENGAPITRAMAAGELKPMDADEAWVEREAAERELFSRGLYRYEVSNYARPGFECRHNLAYWRMDSYIGAGPSAVSTLWQEGGASLRIEEGREPVLDPDSAARAARETRIDAAHSAFEAVMMAFRTAEGLDLESFAARFSARFESMAPRTIAAWKNRLIVFGEDGRRRLALDGSGLDLLNPFLVGCLEEMEVNFPSATFSAEPKQNRPSSRA